MLCNVGEQLAEYKPSRPISGHYSPVTGADRKVSHLLYDNTHCGLNTNIQAFPANHLHICMID